MTVTPESLTSLVGCRYKCLRGGPGRADLSAMVRGWTGRARPGQLDKGLPSPVERCQGQAGRPSVWSGLWQAVCSGHLLSTSEAHCRPPALTAPAGRLPTLSPAGTVSVPWVAGLRLGSPGAAVAAGRVPAPFPKSHQNDKTSERIQLQQIQTERTFKFPL